MISTGWFFQIQSCFWQWLWTVTRCLPWIPCLKQWSIEIHLFFHQWPLTVPKARLLVFYFWAYLFEKFNACFIVDFYSQLFHFFVYSKPKTVNFGGRSIPAVKTDKNYEVALAAPGYDKKDFIFANGISRKTWGKGEERWQLHVGKFGYSLFSRSFNLPTNTKDEDINARYEDGILKLAIAKNQESNGKTRKAITIR